MPEMEGVLFKWTNYLAGWQLRWFVLDKGILAYYKSQDEVYLGSKGSVKIACCEIHVHPSDMCRLDLIIPNEQHFYIRGTSPADRQRWLVALGSSKACLTDARQQLKDRTEETLKAKMSELRLYCDTLMQSVASVKLSAKGHDAPDIQKLNESTSLLSETCDMFVSTLQDCIKLANNVYSAPPYGSKILTETVVPPSLQQQSKKLGSRSHSAEDRYFPVQNKNLEDMVSRRPKLNRGQQSQNKVLSAPTTPTALLQVGNSDYRRNDAGDDPSHSRDEVSARSPTILNIAMQHPGMQEIPKVPTFFTTMMPSLCDVQVSMENGIKTDLFLNACSQLVALFEMLGSAFVPVKVDMNGNIKKLHQKYSIDPPAFPTLQTIVQQEMRSNTHHLKNSATDALMWLTRGLEFIFEFFTEIIRGEKNLSTASSKAYKRSLQKYHGWVIQGVVSLAVRAAPVYEDFMKYLLHDPAQLDHGGELAILEDLVINLEALGSIVQELKQYYHRENLENNEKI